MSELRELYQQVILDHNRHPYNFGPLETANRHQEGFNPLCGDHLHVYLLLNDDGVIEDIHFDGSGCAISKASASLTAATGDQRDLRARGHTCDLPAMCGFHPACWHVPTGAKGPVMVAAVAIGRKGVGVHRT